MIVEIFKISLRNLSLRRHNKPYLFSKQIIAHLRSGRNGSDGWEAPHRAGPHAGHALHSGQSSQERLSSVLSILLLNLLPNTNRHIIINVG